jgi:hypothetical protein
VQLPRTGEACAGFKGQSTVLYGRIGAVSGDVRGEKEVGAMKTLLRMAMTAAIAVALQPGTTQAQDSFHERYIPTGPNGYVYEAQRQWSVPPPYYGPGAYYGAPYYPSYYAMPPYGFGSRYYNGYNDPAFPTYGPGVQEFLYFGGADFYGW